MRVSSAYKVQYDVRPSKQAERRVILDILRCAAEVGIQLDQYKYLGFGGVRFYDFEMIFRHLGIRDMTSLEIDDSLFARCRFNKPFGFIDFRTMSLSDYLDETVFKKPVVAWLDYDCVLTGSVIGEMRRICAAAPLGSFVFATIDAKAPPGLANLKPAIRLETVKDEYGEFALAQHVSELSNEMFPLFAERVLWASIAESFAKRGDGVFVPLLRVFYKDTTLMITVGGCLCPRGLAQSLHKKINREFGFLVPQSNHEPFAIPTFNVTPRERLLLDWTVTRRGSSNAAASSLKRLGFQIS